MLQPQGKVAEAVTTVLQPEPRPPSCAVPGSEPVGHAGAGDAHRGHHGYVVTPLHCRIVTPSHRYIVALLHRYIFTMSRHYVVTSLRHYVIYVVTLLRSNGPLRALQC